MNDTTDTSVPALGDTGDIASGETQPVAAQVASASNPDQEAGPTVSLRASNAVERRMGQPQQGEMPFAVVLGEALTELPKDLYIPPRALEVFLEAF